VAINKIKKINLVVEAPFNKRDHKRFGVDTLLMEGFEVSVWDITKMTRSDKDVRVPDPISFEGLYRFSRPEDLFKAFKRETNAFFVLLISYRRQVFDIFLAISKNKISYAYLFNNNLLPLEISNYRRHKKLIKKNNP